MSLKDDIGRHLLFCNFMIQGVLRFGWLFPLQFGNGV